MPVMHFCEQIFAAYEYLAPRPLRIRTSNRCCRTKLYLDGGKLVKLREVTQDTMFHGLVRTCHASIYA